MGCIKWGMALNSSPTLSGIRKMFVNAIFQFTWEELFVSILLVLNWYFRDRAHGKNDLEH